MRINVSGRQFVFPRICACCGAYADRSLEIIGSERNRRSRTRGWSWDIPYCQGCREHVVATDRLLVLAISGIGVIGLGSVIAQVSWHSILITLSTVGLSVLILGVFVWLGWLAVKATGNPNCVDLTRAIIYHGSAGSFHSFEIKSKAYATAFIEANQRKIVNASPIVAQILHGSVENQVARRLFRH